MNSAKSLTQQSVQDEDKVSFFYGEGLNISADDLGYGARSWRVDDQIAVDEWDAEDGSRQDYYTIKRFERDPDSGALGAIVSYNGNSLELNY